MTTTWKALRIVGGGLLFAIVVYGVLVLPGFVDDQASVVPIQAAIRAVR